jgi:hypothetical protein
VKLTIQLYPVRKAKKEWSFTSTPLQVFMSWCKDRDYLTFTRKVNVILRYQIALKEMKGSQAGTLRVLGSKTRGETINVENCYLENKTLESEFLRHPIKRCDLLNKINKGAAVLK